MQQQQEQDDLAGDQQAGDQQHGSQESHDALVQVLSILSSETLIKTCSLVSTSWHAAALAATVSAEGKGSKSLEAWLQGRGPNLKALHVKGGSIVNYSSMSGLHHLTQLDLESVTAHPALMTTIGGNIQNLMHLRLHEVKWGIPLRAVCNGELAAAASKLWVWRGHLASATTAAASAATQPAATAVPSRKPASYIAPLTQLTSLELSSVRNALAFGLKSDAHDYEQPPGWPFDGLRLPGLLRLSVNDLRWIATYSRGAPLIGSAVRALATAFPGLRELHLGRSLLLVSAAGTVTGTELQPLAALAGSLTYLQLDAHQLLCDQHIVSLAELRGLSCLVLRGAGNVITDMGIVTCIALTSLTSLTMSGVLSSGVSRAVMPYSKFLDVRQPPGDMLKLQPLHKGGRITASVQEQLIDRGCRSAHIVKPMRQILKMARHQARQKAYAAWKARQDPEVLAAGQQARKAQGQARKAVKAARRAAQAAHKAEQAAQQVQKQALKAQQEVARAQEEVARAQQEAIRVQQQALEAQGRIGVAWQEVARAKLQAAAAQQEAAAADDNARALKALQAEVQD